MTKEQFSELEAIQQHIQDMRYKDFGQALQLIYEEMVNLNAWKSFSGKMMAEAKRDLNKAKEITYKNFKGDGTLTKMQPSLVKDYISAQAGDLQFKYDFAERVNSSCAYAIDTLRSILSSLKQEMATIHYTGK